ncbi:hypothetical protein DMC47_34955 [Nostoc sp. 3335mG]|nr:hypothetical protein DMC47_34955 [Nostoc sp. 3335mG]
MKRFAHQVAGHGTSGGRRGASASRIGAAIAALLALLLVGDRAATAFDSPLLAVVAAGMLFLIGVAVHGAVDYGRR